MTFCYDPSVRRLRPYPASRAILEKIEVKHGINWSEVEELFRRNHLVLRGPTDQYGERRYSSLGESAGGRLLLVVYAIRESGRAKVITARNMIGRERKYYQRNFKKRRKQ